MYMYLFVPTGLAFDVIDLSWCYFHTIELFLAVTVLCFALSLALYLTSFLPGRVLAEHGNSGNPIYDFFMGRQLNPRVWKVWTSIGRHSMENLESDIIARISYFLWARAEIVLKILILILNSLHRAVLYRLPVHAKCCLTSKLSSTGSLLVSHMLNVVDVWIKRNLKL